MDNAEHDPETQTLRDLLGLMHEHDLVRLKVRLGDAVYEIDRRDAATAPAPPQGAANTASGDLASDAPPVAQPHIKKIVAPLTGVFYRSASPESEAFVGVGDRVSAGEVLCILEAMKLFNEIQSDYDGTIVRIFAENGELVPQGADLFWIDPA